jgi:hypothetical protein
MRGSSTVARPHTDTRPHPHSPPPPPRRALRVHLCLCVTLWACGDPEPTPELPLACDRFGGDSDQDGRCAEGERRDCDDEDPTVGAAPDHQPCPPTSDEVR